MISSLHLTAPAKVNLSLRILGKRPDGYHEIETLMAPITLADEIELSHAHGHPSSSVVFTCNDPSLPTGDDNLCIKAAKVFQKELGHQEAVSISLLKRIPHGAGLGGGSSDAATILRGMNTLFEEPFVFEELHQLAMQLGSDVPFFLDTQPKWCRGRGEILGEIVSLPDWKLLLIKPPFSIASAEAYKSFEDGKFNSKGKKENSLARIFHHSRDEKAAKADEARQVSNITLSSMHAYCSFPRRRELTQQPSAFPAFAVERDEKSGLAAHHLVDQLSNPNFVSIFNDLEAPIFEKYLQLPILKSFLQMCPEVAATWMTGSGSTMVAALKKEISAKEILHLQKKISAEFGSSFWIKESSFVFLPTASASL